MSKFDTEIDALFPSLGSEATKETEKETAKLFGQDVGVSSLGSFFAGIGSGRAEKIETAAATFLLKDKQQTKQNKAMIDQLKAKIDYQIERGDEISIEKSILAATKGGTGSNKEIARGIQGGTSPTTGEKYKFAGVVDREGLKKKIGTAQEGDTFIVQEKVKDSITGADTTARIIVEIQKDGSAKPIYNLG